MFKDFHRRLQRDLKKIVDARVLASDTRLGGELKVIIFILLSLTLILRTKNSFLIINILKKWADYLRLIVGTTCGS